MNRHFVRRIAPAVVALALTLSFSPLLELCVGPEGHLAIEPVNAPCCQPEDPSANLAPATRCADECVDTPLGAGLVLAAGGGTRQSLAATPPIPAPVFIARVMSKARGMSSSPITLLATPPRHLRTTVNLC